MKLRLGVIVSEDGTAYATYLLDGEEWTEKRARQFNSDLLYANLGVDEPYQRFVVEVPSYSPGETVGVPPFWATKQSDS